MKFRLHSTRLSYMQLVLLVVVLFSVLLTVLIGERGVRGVPA